MREAFDQAVPYALAILVHAAAAVLLVLSVQWPGLEHSAPAVADSVQATVVDEEQVQVEIERIRNRETAKRRAEEEQAEVAREQRAHEERRRQEAEAARVAEERRWKEVETARRAEEERRKEAEASRLVEEERRREAEASRLTEEQRRQEAEAARVAEEQRVREVEAARVAEEQRRSEAEAAARVAEERRRQADEKARRQAELAKVTQQQAREEAERQRRRREEERSRRELMAREQQRLEQERQAIFAKAREEYIEAIDSSVTRNWRPPTGVPRGLKCVVHVEQDKSGKVLSVKVTQGSGNVAFDRSVEQAVRAASPLPAPRQPSLFEPEIVFLFNPGS